MYLDKAKKEEIFSKYGKSNSDTGSAESQIALFSYRIAHLTEHVKKNRKDYTCLLYTSPSPRDGLLSRMPSSA